MKQVRRHRFFRALLLVVIYVLHLGLFNLMMEASFPIKYSFAQVFTKDLKNSENHHHPSLAAYYQRLLKHEDGKKYNFDFHGDHFSQLLFLFSVPVYYQNDQKIVYNSPQDFHLNDDAYKRYSLIRVFLI